jgi:hypothetical protein
MNTTLDSSLHALRELREIELEAARSEIARLRGEIESAHRAREQATAARLPGTKLASSASWLGITAGATLLLGALAITAATGPILQPRSLADGPASISPACPATGAPADLEANPTPPVASVGPAVPKNPPKSRPHATGRPHGNVKAPVTAPCDGTDPLCGIDPKVIDDVGKKPRKR